MARKKKSYEGLKNKGKTQALPSPEDIIKKVSTVSKRGKGRPELKEERLPFTTSLTKKNRKLLFFEAGNRGVRMADVLNEIIEEYFEDKPIKNIG